MERNDEPWPSVRQVVLLKLKNMERDIEELIEHAKSRPPPLTSCGTPLMASDLAHITHNDDHDVPVSRSTEQDTAYPESLLVPDCTPYPSDPEFATKIRCLDVSRVELEREPYTFLSVVRHVSATIRAHREAINLRARRRWNKRAVRIRRTWHSQRGNLPEWHQPDIEMQPRQCCRTKLQGAASLEDIEEERRREQDAWDAGAGTW